MFLINGDCWSLVYTCILLGGPSPLDPHDSYFRVRLICILLDTCGHYFDRGSSKKCLDNFLIFFQCYLFSKRQPLPLEVEHLVLDCIEMLRPGLEMYKTHQEASEAAIELEMKFKDKIGKPLSHHLSSQRYPRAYLPSVWVWLRLSHLLLHRLTRL